MTGKTHILGGMTAGLAVIAATSSAATTVPVVIAASVAGSLLPDIDHPNSKIAHKLPLVSWIVHLSCGHRGLFHAPLFYILLYGIISNIIIQPMWRIVITALFAGIASHLFLDAITVSGIPIFFPFIRKRIHLSRIKTGHAGEFVFAGCLVIVIFGLAQKIFLNGSGLF